MLTITETAKQLNVSRSQVRRLIACRKLKACNVGTGAVRQQLRVDENSVSALLDKPTVPEPLPRRQRRAFKKYV